VLSLAFLGIAASGVALSQGYGPDHRDGGKGACQHTHHVAAGENLTWIADRYGVTVDELARANGLDDADYIVEGQELCIPHGSGRAKYDGDGASGHDDRHDGNHEDGKSNYDRPGHRDGKNGHTDNRECGSWREDDYGYRYQDCVVDGNDGKHYGDKHEGDGYYDDHRYEDNHYGDSHYGDSRYGDEHYRGPDHQKYEQQGCYSHDCGAKSHNRYERGKDWDNNQSCVDHRPGYGYSPYDCGGYDHHDNGNGNGNGDDNGNGNGNEPTNGVG
jgi:hypothetical protein